MPIEFKEATLENSYLRMAITGVSGSGKTLTALKLAKVLGTKTLVVDTENDSAKLFANNPDVPQPYFVYNLTKYKVANYIALLKEAADNGFDVCILDSLTPSWNKKDGVLDQVGGNVRNWKDVGNPQLDALVEAIQSYRSRMHIIATLRAKAEVALEKSDSGSMVVRSLGVQAQHREGLAYEFDIVGYIDQTHTMRFDGIGKQRCEALDGMEFTKPGSDLGMILKHWLQGGVER
jgi:ABC-type dipeptide/oligopeptide/nickel transport system ATPase component